MNSRPSQAVSPPGPAREVEHHHREHGAEHEEDRHGDPRQLLDAAGDPLRDDPQHQHERPGEVQVRRPRRVVGAAADPLERVQVGDHLLLGREPPVVLGQRRHREPRRPRHDVGVVDQDEQRDRQADDAEVLGERVPPQHREHPRHVPLAVAPAVPADPPLDPHQRDAEQQQRDEVRDHERAAAVGGGLPREAEEVAEPDRVPRHREDQPEPRPPALVRRRAVVRHPRSLVPVGASSGPISPHCKRTFEVRGISFRSLRPGPDTGRAGRGGTMTARAHRPA